MDSSISKDTSKVNGLNSRGDQQFQLQPQIPVSKEARSKISDSEGTTKTDCHSASAPSPLSQTKIQSTEQATENRDCGPLDSRETRVEGTKTVMRFSPAEMYELVPSPNLMPMNACWEEVDDSPVRTLANSPQTRDRWTISEPSPNHTTDINPRRGKDRRRSTGVAATSVVAANMDHANSQSNMAKETDHSQKQHTNRRTVSTPLIRRRISSIKANTSSKTPSSFSSKQAKSVPPPLRFEDSKLANRLPAIEAPQASPMPKSIPVPPLSLPTYLQLELSSQRPSPLYIHRSVTSDFPYESSRVKMERLQNFLLLPPQLEQVLWFGALACLDAWLFSFTILPLRFLNALWILCRSWGRNIVTETRFIGAFIYVGTGRMWRRRRRESLNGSASPIPVTRAAASPPLARTPRLTLKRVETEDPGTTPTPFERGRRPRNGFASRRRRIESTPSALSPDHKADLLKGLLILLSCMILMYFDASRMYHGIRGQAAIKLYVIYNVLEASPTPRIQAPN